MSPRSPEFVRPFDRSGNRFGQRSGGLHILHIVPSRSITITAQVTKLESNKKYQKFYNGARHEGIVAASCRQKPLVRRGVSAISIRAEKDADAIEEKKRLQGGLTSITMGRKNFRCVSAAHCHGPAEQTGGNTATRTISASSLTVTLLVTSPPADIESDARRCGLLCRRHPWRQADASSALSCYFF